MTENERNGRRKRAKEMYDGGSPGMHETADRLKKDALRGHHYKNGAHAVFRVWLDIVEVAAAL